MRREGGPAWEPRGARAGRARSLPVCPWRCAPALLGDRRLAEAGGRRWAPPFCRRLPPGRVASRRPLRPRVARLARLFAAHAVAMATSAAPPGPAASSRAPRSGASSGPTDCAAPGEPAPGERRWPRAPGHRAPTVASRLCAVSLGLGRVLLLASAISTDLETCLNAELFCVFLALGEKKSKREFRVFQLQFAHLPRVTSRALLSLMAS